MSYNLLKIYLLIKSNMTLMYLGIYTLVLVIIWCFFIVAKIHAYKFKNFSNNITKVTKVILILLIVLSILWYLIIIFSTDNSNNTIDFEKTDFNFKEINY